MTINECVRTMLRAAEEFSDESFGEEVMANTPDRVARYWLEEALAGYRVDLEDLFKTFDASDFHYDQMVVVRDVDFTSTCAHHLLPFAGKAHVGYIPDQRQKKVVGLSKLARLVDCFARRLQLQERMTDQICWAVAEHAPNVGAACVIEASHLCLACRGARKANAVMVTSSLRGAFRNSESSRNEFLCHCGIGTR